MASKTLKPFQGLKLMWWWFRGDAWLASKTLKPFQGLKHTILRFGESVIGIVGFKNSETLLGIETKYKAPSSFSHPFASKTLKPFQGLKLKYTTFEVPQFDASKTLKPFQGLKHCCCCCYKILHSCFKNSETLLGIETLKSTYTVVSTRVASKTLKPFQGLKL